MEGFKTEAFLYIYNKLQEGKVVSKAEVLEKCKINERSFYRYMKSIKDFVENPLGDLAGEELISDRKKGGYYLKGKSENSINEKEVLAISKVMLESRGLVKKEIEVVLNKLLEHCYSDDKENVKRIIGNELLNYVSPQHGKELLNILWDLSCAIKEQRIIDIEYYKVGQGGKLASEISKRRLRPEAIIFSEYDFYLLAYIDGKGYEFPAIYRVDRIEKLKIMEEKFKVEYSKRFQDGDFRKKIQFMYAGRLQRIAFEFSGSSVEAVLDRIPTARIVNQGEGKYLIEAELYGDGIIMWLLSQGSNVKVISPQRLVDKIKEEVEKLYSYY